MVQKFRCLDHFGISVHHILFLKSLHFDDIDIAEFENYGKRKLVYGWLFLA